MMRERAFLYFIPGQQTKPTEEQLAALGLIDQLGAGNVAHRAITQGRGPSGTPGVVVALEHAKVPGYHPDDQTWMEIPKTETGGGYWLGWWKDAIPRPRDLARTEQLDGHVVELGDGHEWLVPCARQAPQTMTFDPATGAYACAAMACYAWLMAIAQEWWDAISAALGDDADPGDKTVFTVADATPMAIRALGANYHVGPCEAVLAMKLLTTQNVRSVLNAVADVPDFKKKLQAASP